MLHQFFDYGFKWRNIHSNQDRHDRIYTGWSASIESL